MLGVESGLPMLSLMEVFLNEKTLVNSSVTVVSIELCLACSEPLVSFALL
jgi:hypothetical protein